MEGNRNQLADLRTLRVVFLCFIVILLEGFDIQAAGVAAPRLVPDFGLKPSQIGAFFSASALGSLLFTAIGGLLSDRFGYKPVIIGSTLTFGLFCFLTPYAPSFEALVALRFLTGAGLGASLPPVLAMVSDHSPVSQKRRWIGVTYSAISLGGMAAAGILAAGLVAGWKQVFYIGGVLPVAVALAMAFFLPRSRPASLAPRAPKAGWNDILGSGKAATTLAMWLAAFLTLGTMYLLVMWLPSLMKAKGIADGGVFTIQMLYNLGSTLAALSVGYALDRKHVFSVPLIGYLSLAAGLAYLGGMPIDLLGGAIAGFMLGAGVTTGQTLIYAFAPPCYPLAIRATGVGYVVAAGRIGTMAGPFAAGLLLSSGMTVGQVLTYLAPVALITLAVALAIAQLVRAGQREAAPVEPLAAALASR